MHGRAAHRALAWRPIEEDASGRGDVEALKELRVDQREEDHLLQRADVVVQAAHLVEAHRGVHLAQHARRAVRRARVKPRHRRSLRAHEARILSCSFPRASGQTLGPVCPRHTPACPV